MAEPALRPRLEAAIDGVEGWFLPDEAWALHEAVRLGVDPARDCLAVEIGSWKGRSTIVLGLAVKARGRGRVITVDPHETSLEAEPTRDRMSDLLDNLREAGVEDVVEPLRATSHEARLRVADGTVDLLFVDGSHDYEDVLQDIDDWTSALVDRAIVAFHDSSWSGVRRALSKRMAVSGTPFRRPRHVRGTVYFEFRRGVPRSLGGALDRWRLRSFFLAGRVFDRLHARARAAGRRRARIATEVAAWLVKGFLLPSPTRTWGSTGRVGRG